MDKFEQDSRQKLRYQSGKGEVRSDDLWDMPLEHETKPCLENIAVALDKEISANGTKSFVRKRTKKNATLQLKLDIVTHIIDVRLEEAKQKENRAANKTEADRLDKLIEDKETNGLSLADLKKKRKKLNI